MQMPNPRIAITSNLRPTGELKGADPVNAYMHGYLDAIGSFDSSILRYVTSLRIMGWKDQDILKALLMTLHSYATGKGIEETVREVFKRYTGKEKLGNG